MAEWRRAVPSLVNVAHKFGSSNSGVAWLTFVLHLTEVVAGPVDERIAAVADGRRQPTLQV